MDWANEIFESVQIVHRSALYLPTRAVCGKPGATVHIKIGY